MVLLLNYHHLAPQKDPNLHRALLFIHNCYHLTSARCAFFEVFDGNGLKHSINNKHRWMATVVLQIVVHLYGESIQTITNDNLTTKTVGYIYKNLRSDHVADLS